MIKNGDIVIIRADRAGIMIGAVGTSGASGTSGEVGERFVALENARQIWSWEGGALCVADIAARGLHGKGNRVSAVVDCIFVQRNDIVQMIKMTGEAIAAMERIDPWQQ
jgi:hypothetical protein